MKFLNLINRSNNLLIGQIIFKRLNSSQTSAKATANRDEPVKYSTSNARTYDSINTFSNRSGRTKPKSEPFIILLSTMTFFVYFALLREENEIDEILSRSLEDSVPNIRIMSLRQQIAQYDQLGLDTRQLKEALAKEVPAQKKISK